mmetsp:Transcript_2774/g.6324  ORF Transcript_2774/g.6324 Transcript_2774/m.6324 type:complete len:238 (+) Transcript_2774:352-1065(+)
MFPNIKSKNREHNLIGNSLHQRVILIRSSNEFQLISLLVHADPYPSRSKESSRSGTCLERCLHFVERSEGFVDHGLKISTGLGLFGFIRWCHLVPEEGMVIMSTPIVPHRRPGLQSIQLQLQNINLILSLRSLVDVGNISSMMLIMMDFHGRSIDVGLEGLKGVVKVGNRVGVGYEGCSDGGGDGGSLFEDLSAVGSGLHFHGDCRPGGGRSCEQGGNSKGKVHGDGGCEKDFVGGV